MKDLTPELSSFNQLFEDRRLIIPFFQRDYIWKKDNWEEWLQNIKDLIDCGDIEEIHFVGSIIFKKAPDQQSSSYSDYEIIDGQQRITTFFSFSLALLEFLDKDNSNNANLKEDINKLIFVDPFNKTPKLIMKGNDETSLDGVIKHKNLENNEEKVFEAYQWFMRALKRDDTRNYTLPEILKKLKNKMKFILIKLGETDDALEIFKSINTSGSTLTSADLVKAELFTLWENRGLEGKKLFYQWEELKKRVSEESLDHFFYTFLNTKFKKTSDYSEKNYYRFFKNKVLNEANSVEELWEKIVSVSKIYSEISNPQPNYWGEYFYLPILERKVLDLKQLYPLIIILKDKLKEKIFQAKKEANILQKLINYSFRKTRIKGKMIQQNEVSKWSNLIKNEEYQLELILSNSEIQEEIEEGNLWEKLEKKQLKQEEIKFLLTKFYLHLLPKGFYFFGLQLEHMFPKKPHEEWWLIKEWGNLKDSNKELIKEKTNSLGNFTFLNSEQNILASNKVWEKKKSEIGEKTLLHYEKNELNLLEKSVLMPEHIDKRKKYLIDFFRKTGILFIDEKKEKLQIELGSKD